MSEESRVYGVTGIIIGVITFFGCWIYAASEWGFLLGFGLGWIPSFFIGLIAGFIGPAILVIVLFIGAGLFIYSYV
jgi:hypothetical protein